MFELLFVDDDALIIEGVRNMLEWERLSINTPHIAYSYDQALEIFDRAHIDILVSDIEMLGLSGIDLMGWVRRNRPRTLCCFLTCHALFDYAQRAIQLGTHGYLLKPIDATALEEFLSRCVLQLTNKGSPDTSDQQTVRSNLVRLAVSHIERNFTGVINRETISRELCVSESKLSHVFNQEVGMSITEYITECRLKRAMELLVSSNLTITEICARVGYNYPAYFTKTFRERTGRTPYQFRNESR